SGRVRTTLKGGVKKFQHDAFVAEGKHIVTADMEDTMIHRWEPASGRQISSIKAHPEYEHISTLAVSPDGNLLFTAGGRSAHVPLAAIGLYGEIKVWEAATGKHIKILPVQENQLV